MDEGSDAGKDAEARAAQAGSPAAGARAARDGRAGDEDRRERLVALGEIAAEVAHELRNTLQIISANVYLAKLDPSKSAPQLGKIERSARLAHAIVDDLMALARGEPAHAELVSLAQVLAAAREDLPERAATYHDRVEPEDLEVRAHPGLLARCLHVLYDNAIAVTSPRPPTLVTRAWAEASRVVIEVTDDGPGVPPELAATLFEPLVTGRAGGSGLGLALARRIVAAHGGTIALLPPKPATPAPASRGGTGATFRIELPLGS